MFANRSIALIEWCLRSVCLKFSTMCSSCEQEIAEPLFHLKLAMEQLSASQTFRYILATVLAIGNFLNGCKVSWCLIDRCWTYTPQVPLKGVMSSG